MTTFMKTKFKKSNDQMNIDNIEQLQIFQNNILYQKLSSVESLFQNSWRKLINQESQKQLCLKWTYRLFGNDYRVLSFFKKQLTAKGKIPESLKSIRQFCINQLFHVKMSCFKLDVRTFWSGLQNCYAFYILPKCIRNPHTKFENHWTILTCIDLRIKNAKIFIFKMDILTMYYRVASLFTRYLIPKGIIPESLNSIGQFKHAEINGKDLTVSYGRTDSP